MSLRRRFIILVAGTTIIPLAVLAFTFLVIRFGLQTPIDDFRTAQRWLEHSLNEQLAEGGWDAAIGGAPEGLTFTVHEIDQRPFVAISAGTAAADTAPAALAERLLSEASPQSGPQLGSLALPLEGPGGRRYLMVVDLPSTSPLVGSLPFTAVLVLELLLLAFTAGIAITVIRRLQHGVKTLSLGAERIASGDFRSEIRVSGHDEISDLAEAFNHMRTRIQASQEQSARFMMGVSHDLKSPLGLISGYADAILDGKAQDPAQLARFAGIIRDRADLLETRIESLLDLARLETREWRARLSERPLRPFLEHLVGRYRADAGLLDREFESDIRIDDGLTAVFDPELTERALENLLVNAFRYSTPGSRVRLEATGSATSDADPSGPEAPRIRIINDTDAALEGREDQLFEPFWRGSAGRNEAGSGLGLSIARSILTAQGWTLTATSRRTSGTATRRLVMEARVATPGA